MLHPMHTANAADEYRKNAMRQAEVRRMLRASRKGSKQAGTRRSDGSPKAWRNLVPLGTS
jgi:hypothetical protein